MSDNKLVSDDELSGSKLEEEYSWEAIGGKDVHNSLYGHADVTVFQSYLLTFQYSMNQSFIGKLWVSAKHGPWTVD